MSEQSSKPKSSSIVPKKKQRVIHKKKPGDDRFGLGSKPVDESYFERNSTK